jgi:hypothetical protein
MARVKAGDLAYLVKASLPENIGKVVEVLYQNNNILSPHPGVHWVIRFSAPTRGIFSLDNSIVENTEMACPDSWLVPIAGPSIGNLTDESIDNTEKLSSPV